MRSLRSNGSAQGLSTFEFGWTFGIATVNQRLLVPMTVLAVENAGVDL
jgi:hypothetical protein